MATFLVRNGTAFFEFEKSIDIKEKLSIILFHNENKVCLLDDGFEQINTDPFVIGVSRNPKILHDFIVENHVNRILVNDVVYENLNVDNKLQLEFDSATYIQNISYNKPKKASVFTHVYNEGFMLDLWIKYYSGIVGYDNLYVIDHGSSNNIKDRLPKDVNWVRLPRGDYDNWNISTFCAYFQRFLLTQYEWVIHTDCDEFLMVSEDNDFNKIFEKYKNKNIRPNNAYNVIHDYKNEGVLDVDRNLLPQRNWMRFDSSFQKCAITSSPVTWGPGFHKCYDKFEDSYEVWLFHLKYIDTKNATTRCTTIWQNLNQTDLDKKFFHLENDAFYNSKTEDEVKKNILVEGCIEIPNWAKLYL